MSTDWVGVAPSVFAIPGKDDPNGNRRGYGDRGGPDRLPCLAGKAQQDLLLPVDVYMNLFYSTGDKVVVLVNCIL